MSNETKNIIKIGQSMKSLKTYSSSSRRKNLQRYSLKNVKTILWKDLLMHKNECTNGHWQMKKH